MAGKLPLSALHMAKNGQLPDLKATYAALQQSLKSQKPHTSLTEGGVWKTASTTSLASDMSEVLLFVHSGNLTAEVNFSWVIG